MFLRPGVGVHLQPVENFAPAGPASVLLFRWHEANFSKIKCVQILKEYIKEQKLPKTHGLNVHCLEDEKAVGANECLYFSPPEEWFFGFRTQCHRETRQDFGSYVSTKEVGEISTLLEGIAVNDDLVKLQKDFDFLSKADFKKIFQKPHSTSKLNSIWQEKIEPGIYRREHASVMISSEKTQILFDPVYLAPFGTPPEVSWLRPSLSKGAPPDGILITHSHRDHWQISTLLASLKEGARVFVPNLPKPSRLCSDFSSELKITGVPHRVVNWGETFKVGDIEIDVLPFYGEQPSATLSPNDPNLRNWGNCYRVNTPQFSAFILVDSGRDPLGNMLEVVKSSVKKRGPADTVLACMREFHAPFWPTGLDSFVLSLSFSQLKQMSKEYKSGNLQSSTAGLDPKQGIASICAAAKAKCFLPYAQGYAGQGMPIPAHDWGPSIGSEKVAMNKLATQLQALKLKTVAQSWNPGDRIFFEDNKVLRVKFKT